jgi:type I restriction enzyme S subunit
LWEVVKIIWWWTPPKNKPEYYWWNILWATVRDMNVMVIKDTELKITEEWLRNSSANIIPSNWIIIATRVWLWKVSLISQDTAINQDLKWIIPNNELENKFLYRFFQSISNYILQNWIGATVKWVNLDFIKNLEIPLPPLQKQKEIVEYLDEVFAKNKELKTKYELQLKELEELKQSLLKDAFEGRLLKE